MADHSKYSRVVPVNEPPVKQEKFSADWTEVSFELMNKGGTAIHSPFVTQQVTKGDFYAHLAEFI